MAERADWLAQTQIPTLLWTPEADPLLASWKPEWSAGFPECPDLGQGLSSARRLSQCWFPDFLLLARTPDQQFRFVGGAVCFPSGWAPEEKLGRTVETIHQPVPTLNQRLGAPIQTFLARIPPGQSFERLNWGIAASHQRNGHPLRRLPKLTSDFPWAKAWLRVEHQSFHSLPFQGGLLFLIHLTLHPLNLLTSDPGIALGLSAQLATMPDSIAAYKGLAAVRERWATELASEARCGIAGD